MTDKNLTTEPSSKLGEVMLKVMDGLCLSGDEHLSFGLKEDDRLSDVKNLKIKIVKDIIDFYNKYPTLHSINFHYYEQPFGLAHQGWNVSISQIAWDSVENIKNTQEFKDSNLNLYAFCHNSMGAKRELNIIPFGANQLTSVSAIKKELQHNFHYLTQNPDLALRLRNQVNRSILEKNRDGVKSRIGIDSRNCCGGKNLKIQDDIKDFFGQDMMSELLYLGLDDKINVKTDEKQVRKVKI